MKGHLCLIKGEYNFEDHYDLKTINLLSLKPDEARYFEIVHNKLIEYLGDKVDPTVDIDLCINKILNNESKDTVWVYGEDLKFVKKLHYEGFLIMGVDIPFVSGINMCYTLCKFHNERCVNFLDEKIFSNLIHKSTLRLSKKYVLKVNHDVKNALDYSNIVHKNCWLNSHIKNIYLAWSESDDVSQFLTFELHDLKENKLIAADLGIICGAIYSSVSGFTLKKNIGKLQIVCLMKILYLLGYQIIDLGMVMQYKIDLGVSKITSQEWNGICRKYRESNVKQKLSSIDHYICYDILRNSNLKELSPLK